MMQSPEPCDALPLTVDEADEEHVRLYVGGQKSGVTVTQTATGITFEGRVTE